jgi:hypothetical protein
MAKRRDRKGETLLETRDDSVAEAVTWFEFVESVEAGQRMREEEDLGFQVPEGAWPADVADARAALMPGQPGYPTALGGVPVPARPMISIASLDEPIALVTSQERSAHLGVTIHALSEDASDATAEVMQGIYRCIERDSRAHLARSWGYQRALWAGRGAWRILKEHDAYGGHDLDQKLVIKRILDQSTLYLDPYAQEPDWLDGKRSMIVVGMPWQEYKRKWPGSKVASFDDGALTTLSSNYSGWIGSDSNDNREVRVAEEWRVEITERKKVLLDNHSMAYDDEIPDDRTVLQGDAARERTIETRQVRFRIINCFEVLQDWQDWDGAYDPFVPVIAKELLPRGGKREWIGMVTNAKGAVRLTNFAASAAVEKAALEPKAPWIGEEGVFEGHEQEFLQSNIRNIPFIQHRGQNLSGQKAEEPHRVQVDVQGMSVAMQLLAMGKEFIQTATAYHDPSLGKQTPAFRSGKAIAHLQDQSTETSSVYLDHLANISMMCEATKIIDLIPKVYDRPQRIARILDKQNKSSLVMLNHPFVPQANGRPQALPYGTPDEKTATDAMVADSSHPAKHYDLTKGLYGLEVTIGKSYADERDQGVSEMGGILQADPALLQVIGPEYFQYRGEPWAEQVAALLRKQRDHTMPWLADQQTQATAQQLQQAQQMAEQAGQKVQELQKVIDAKQVEQAGKVQIAQLESDAKAKLAIVLQTMKDATAIRTATITAAKEREAAEAEALQESIALGQQHGFDAAQAAMDRAHEALMGSADHQATLQQADQSQQHALEQGDQGHQQALEQQQQAAALAPPEPAATGNGQPA